MRKPVVPRLYTYQLSGLSTLLRVVGADKRLTTEQFAKVNAAVNDITVVLSTVHLKPLAA